jgi:tRNA A-37 threonylcarbamoyl transferase component Bud32
VALRVRSLAETGSWDSHERFEESARWLAAVSHPGFPKVFAFEPATENASFVLLERLHETLHARVLRGGDALDAAGLESLLRGLLEATACIHREGRVHGDVSPHTVMFRHESDRPVLTGCGLFVERGDASEDVRAVAETVLFARRARVPSALRPLLSAMLAKDRGARPANAMEALRMLDGAPLPRSLRTKAIAAMGIGLAVSMFGAVEWQPHARAKTVEAAGPGECRVVSDPPNASVFLGDPDVAWTEEHPLAKKLGTTPLIVDRDARHPLVVYAEGYKPFVLELGAQTAHEDAPCSFSVKLTAD